MTSAAEAGTITVTLSARDLDLIRQGLAAVAAEAQLRTGTQFWFDTVKPHYQYIADLKAVIQDAQALHNRLM